MSGGTKINEIAPKEAESKTEKMLLGFVAKQASEIGFGEFVVEFKVRNGKLVTLKSQEKIKTFSFGE